MIHLRLIAVALALSAAPSTIYATRISGVITSVETGAPLAGVNIRIQGLPGVAQTDNGGSYSLSDLQSRIYILTFSHVGHERIERRIALTGEDRTVDIGLTPILFPGQAITVTAARAIERETPVTFSNLGRKELQDRFHTQGIPTMLAELPSITTYSEGGNNVGYTYLTLRGFDQRRISVMINGVPQNDPEDHNVYWVNFPDLASSLEDIQVQRGAGSAFYGPAAIGGSINLVTDRFSPDPRLTVTSGYSGTTGPSTLIWARPRRTDTETAPGSTSSPTSWGGRTTPRARRHDSTYMAASIATT